MILEESKWNMPRNSSLPGPGSERGLCGRILALTSRGIPGIEIDPHTAGPKHNNVNEQDQYDYPPCFQLQGAARSLPNRYDPLPASEARHGC